jgi:hypothetical protein
VTATGKPFWITELQAEPWEESQTQFLSEAPKSMNVSLLRSNINRAKKLHPDAIILWGYEYWLWKKLHGDDRLWNCVKALKKEMGE